MKTPWKLRDKAEELFRVNRSYIHTYKTLGLLHLNLFKDFSFLWCQFVELFCYLFSCLFACLFVCLSLCFFLFFVFLGPCCFNSRWWNLHIWCLKFHFRKICRISLGTTRTCQILFQKCWPKVLNLAPKWFLLPKQGFCNLVGISNGKDCSEFNRGIW
jgi:hypothetical protein